MALKRSGLADTDGSLDIGSGSYLKDSRSGGTLYKVLFVLILALGPHICRSYTNYMVRVCERECVCVTENHGLAVSHCQGAH